MKKIFYLFFAIFASCTSALDLNVPVNNTNGEEEVIVQDYLVINASDSNLEINSDGGNATITISTNNSWVASSNADWCHVVNSVGEASDNYIVNISLDKNVTISSRETSISFTAGEKTETAYITQDGAKPDTLIIKTNGAGTLYQLMYESLYGVTTENTWGNDVWDFVKTIIISGDIDARDFDAIKWNLQKIENVDFSNCSIKHYEGEYGTNEGYYDGDIYSVYKENEVPIGSFFYWMFHKFRTFPEEFYDEGMKSLLTVKLPESVTAINRNAFARAYSLKEVNIPEGVTEIGMVAFRYCTSLEVLNIPSTVTKIGWLCFTDMYSLKEVHIKAINVPKHDQSFGNYPDSDNRGYVVVGDSNYDEKTNATLYVPKGQLEKYTKEWGKYFNTIVEEE